MKKIVNPCPNLSVGDKKIEEQYIQFLREQHMRDISLLPELPEDYTIDCHTKPKEYVEINHEPNL